MNHAPLHTLNPLDRFSDRAADYASYRPTYPDEAIGTVLADLGEPSTLMVADIGAGTGISSRLIGDRGAKVWAIEPNAAMRDSALPHPNVENLAGTAESTGLPDHSVDLVTCCQSFHWFEPGATLTEFHRILKPGRRVALLWNERDLTDSITHAYDEILRQVSDPRFFERRDRKSAAALEASSLFINYRALTFSHHHPLTLDGLMGLAQSSSYVSREKEAIATLTQKLQTLTAETPIVTLTYNTQVYLADAIAS